MENTINITDKKRNLIFINILVTCIASSMLATALTTAMPPIIEDFQISMNQGQWMTSGYSLAMAIMMPLTAFLITRFPTKKLYISAIILFIAGLSVCVISPNFKLFMAGRILQACGNGILTSMAQVVLLTIYPPEKRGTVMGWYGLSIGAAPVIAPTIAGVMIDIFNWRIIFYAAIVIVAVSLIMAIKIFSNVLENTPGRFDVPSFVLSIFAFGGITLGVGNVGSYSVTSPQFLVPLVTGGIAGVLFIYRQLHQEKPFLELRTLKNRDYALSVIGSMLLYFVMMGASVIMPLYVQSILGRSATVSALTMMPGSVVMALISPLAGRIYDKLGIRKLFISGAAFMLVSNLGMCFIGTNTSLVIAAFLNMIRCAAIGCLMMPLVTWGVSTMDHSLTAHGTALLTSLRTIAGAIGAAFFVAVMTLTADGSADTGNTAMMHGLNMAFAAMTVSNIIFLLISMSVGREK